MLGELEAFAEVYARRPIQDNSGGMSSTHLFLFWFVLRKLQPATVIESGVWRGQGTWLIEQALPNAAIVSIDINWSNLKYRSSRAVYLDEDFSRNDWGHLNKDTTLVFLDDHVNALSRVKQCVDLGFRHLIFEDNYFPADVSDVYSLKLAFAGAGYTPPRTLRYWAGRLTGTRSDKTVKPNAEDGELLRRLCKVYEELPPIFLPPVNRWGRPSASVPTEQPLLTEVAEPWQQIYFDEAKWYTWMCYVELYRSAARADGPPLPS